MLYSSPWAITLIGILAGRLALGKVMAKIPFFKFAEILSLFTSVGKAMNGKTRLNSIQGKIIVGLNFSDLVHFALNG